MFSGWKINHRSENIIKCFGIGTVKTLTLALAICFAIKNELPVCLKEVLGRIIDRIKLEHFTIFP